MFCVMCAIDIFLNKIMKSKFCVKKCQENVLQFMIIHGKDGTHAYKQVRHEYNYIF